MSKVAKVLLPLFAALIALARVIWPEAHLDSVTVVLLLVALLPWLLPMVKSVELPRVAKIDLADVHRVGEVLEAADLAVPAAEAGEEDAFALRLAEGDPNLAMAALRVELERQLVEVAVSRGLPLPGSASVSDLVRALHRREVLVGRQADALYELISLLNHAAHGVYVSPAAARWAAEVGPRILGALEAMKEPAPEE